MTFMRTFASQSFQVRTSTSSHMPAVSTARENRRAPTKETSSRSTNLAANFASEHKDLIGEEGERDGEHPRERIGRQQLPLQDIPQQPKGKDIDRRGQDAEQNVQKHLWGSQEPPNFFQLFHMNPILFVCL